MVFLAFFSFFFSVAFGVACSTLQAGISNLVNPLWETSDRNRSVYFINRLSISKASQMVIQFNIPKVGDRAQLLLGMLSMEAVLNLILHCMSLALKQMPVTSINTQQGKAGEPEVQDKSLGSLRQLSVSETLSKKINNHTNKITNGIL